MALAITPAVSGARRRWWRDVALYWVGSVLGSLVSIAAAVVAAAGFAAAGGRRGALVAACIVAALGLLREAGLPVPLPYRRRQVPSTWRDELAPGPMSFLYGFSLGVGFLTLFTSSTHLTFVVLAPFAAWPLMLVSALLYGAGKTLVLLLAAGTCTHAEVLERVTASARGRGVLVARRALGAGLSALMIASAMLSMKGI